MQACGQTQYVGRNPVLRCTRFRCWQGKLLAVGVNPTLSWRRVGEIIPGILEIRGFEEKSDIAR